MEDGFSSYSSLYDTSSLLQFCNGKKLTDLNLSLLVLRVDMTPADSLNFTPSHCSCVCVYMLAVCSAFSTNSWFFAISWCIFKY